MSAVSYDLKVAAEALWKVAVASVILGAGLPALFAVGIRSLAWGHGGDAGRQDAGAVGARPHLLGTALAWLIFLVVAYAIAAGIVYVVATGKGSNYDITFRHLIPEIYRKTG